MELQFILRVAFGGMILVPNHLAGPKAKIKTRYMVTYKVVYGIISYADLSFFVWFLMAQFPI